MQLVESAIEDTVRVIEKEHQIDWSQMLDLIHLTNMEKSLKSGLSECFQYFQPNSFAQGIFYQFKRLVSVDF